MSTFISWTTPHTQIEDADFLVLHLHWRPPASAGSDPQCFVWAESGSASQPKRQRGRLAAHPPARPHPFAVADSDHLRRLLQNFDPGIITSGQEILTLWLPATRTGVLPSPDLVHNWDLDRKDPRLEAWQVPAISLPLTTFIDLVSKVHTCRCPDHMVLASDLLFWNQAFNLVLDVLVGQHYVPTLMEDEDSKGRFFARWQPIFDIDDVKASLVAIAQAMPPICRSELDQKGEEQDALSLLKGFISVVSDHLIRAWGQSAPHRLGYLQNHQPISAWLRALVDSQPDIEIPEAQARTLAADIRLWQRNLAPTGNTSYVIALRLRAPAPIGDHDTLYVPESGWRLDYLLQAREDPDLLIEASQVWQTQEDVLVFREQRFQRPQEKLLKALGRAAQIFAPIEKSLQAPTPTGVDLDTTQVYQFLREASPILRQSGFELILPSWWQEAGARLGLKLHLTPLQPYPPDIVSDPESGDKPVAYYWELVLGDTHLTQTAFADLVALRSPLVQKGEHWLRLDPEEIEAAERFWQRQSFEGRLDLKLALRLALGLDEHFDIGGLPVHQVLLGGWLPQVIGLLGEDGQTLRTAAQPQALVGTLRPYQRYGYAWLHAHRHLGLGACLADDMGLGKSVQAIALLLREQAEQGVLPAPTLLICPTSLLGNWRREFERFAPDLRIFIHYGSDRPRDDTFHHVLNQHDIVLTSYTLARRDSDLMQAQTWYGLILDEAQKIKNPETQTAQIVNRIPAEFRLALTGTPVENRLIELWSIFNFLNRGYLGSQSSFRKQFAYPIERYQDPVITARLQRMVRPFVLRRLKSDPTVIQDLPERLEMKVYCTPSDEQVQLYQQVVEEGLPRIADSRGRARRIHVFNLLTRLKQILNHPVQYQYQISGQKLPPEPLDFRSGKLDRLTAMLEEVLETGDRALVFTQFAEMGHLLSAHIQQTFDCRVYYLYGGVPASKRQQMITRFQEDPHSAPIFVLTLKTGGLGLNLTAANHVFHYDRWWNPAVENQASDRTFRIGQSRNVQIHKLITAGTLEEAIDEMIERKQGLAEAIIGQDDNWIANLSDDDLADLFTLEKERF